MKVRYRHTTFQVITTARSSTETNLKVGAPIRRKAQEKNWVVPLHFFGSTLTKRWHTEFGVSAQDCAFLDSLLSAGPDTVRETRAASVF